MRHVFKERGSPWGILTLRVFRRGKFLYEDREHNVLTNGGKNQWVRRLFGGSTATGVDRMEAGDGGCDSSSLFTPQAFAATDNALRTSINLHATVQAGPVYDSGSRTVKYVAVFSSAIADPAEFHYTPRVINEFALKTASPDNKVIALRATRSILFDPDEAVEVEATWEIGLD